MSDPLYKLSEKALFTSVGDDILALNVEDGKCYGMEKVSAAVWGLLGDPTTLERICERLVEQYDVEPAVCRADVERLIGQFKSGGLIEEVKTTPATGTSASWGNAGR